MPPPSRIPFHSIRATGEEGHELNQQVSVEQYPGEELPDLVEVETKHEQMILVLTPNRSMSWQMNKYVLGVMVIWSGSIGIGFLLLGAWVIMPFIGLELLALGAALYYVSWKLSHREVVHISADRVLLERGVQWPKKSWHWPRQSLRVAITIPKHELQTPEINLSAEGRPTVRVGEFLNLDDCKLLIKQLIASGLIIRRQGATAEMSF